MLRQLQDALWRHLGGSSAYVMYNNGIGSANKVGIS